jgi:hypothetical protein
MTEVPRIVYRVRDDATPETEMNALAACYRFILNCHAQREVAEPTPEPDRRDDAKEWKHG